MLVVVAFVLVLFPKRLFVPTSVVIVPRVAKKSVLVACVEVASVDERNCTVEDAVLMKPPVLKIWSPVHVGVIDWESAGAASERMKVSAEPFTAASPMVAEGFAPRGAGARHVPFTAKQPLAMLMPSAAVVVAPPRYSAPVVVALPFRRVSPDSVVEETLREVPVACVKPRLVMVPLVAKRSVEVARVVVLKEKRLFVPVSVVMVPLVAKRSVEVDWVLVASVLERYSMVVEESPMSPPVKVFSAVHVLGEVVAGKSPMTAVRAKVSVYWERHVAPSAKQPLAMLMPFAAVVVAPPRYSAPEVVALPVMRVSPSVLDAELKYCKVEEPKAVIPCESCAEP